MMLTCMRLWLLPHSDLLESSDWSRGAARSECTYHVRGHGQGRRTSPR